MARYLERTTSWMGLLLRAKPLGSAIACDCLRRLRSLSQTPPQESCRRGLETPTRRGEAAKNKVNRSFDEILWASKVVGQVIALKKRACCGIELRRCQERPPRTESKRRPGLRGLRVTCEIWLNIARAPDESLERTMPPTQINLL